MKLNNQEIQQLIFFKKLAVTNRLDQLILEEEEPYPLPEYTVNEIYSSQYATAIHTIKEEGLANLTNDKNHKENNKRERQSILKKHHEDSNLCRPLKYPLPLAFAYFQSYLQQRQYDKAIDIIKNHLQKKCLMNQHIINYNLSFLYREIIDSRTAIFCLESVLKEKPFFQYAIIDYSFLLAMNNRSSQALQLLKRHLVGNNNSKSTSPLAQSSFVQSMFLNLAFKSQSVSLKDIIKIFNNKALSIQTFFNLGLYFKKMRCFDKSEMIFCKIIEQFDKEFTLRRQKELSYSFKQKDQKVYFYSKINLSEVYEQRAIEIEKKDQNNEKDSQIRAYKHKAYQILNSLISDSGQAASKYYNLLTKHSQTIKQKLLNLNQDICSKTNNFFFQYDEKHLLKSSKNMQKREQKQSELKILNSKENLLPFSNISSQFESGTAQNQSQRNELALMKQFNKKFMQRRLQNQKKLKFLLLKDKQLDNFFNTLPKIKIDKNQMSQLLSKEQTTLLNSTNVITADLNVSINNRKIEYGSHAQNQTLIKKLRKQLQDDNNLSRYEQQFQKKKVKYAQEFQNYDLDEALSKIMEKIFTNQISKEKELIVNLPNRTIAKEKNTLLGNTTYERKEENFPKICNQNKDSDLMVHNQKKNKHITIERKQIQTPKQNNANKKAQKFKQRQTSVIVRKGVLSQRKQKKQGSTSSNNFKIKNTPNILAAHKTISINKIQPNTKQQTQIKKEVDSKPKNEQKHQKQTADEKPKNKVEFKEQNSGNQQNEFSDMMRDEIIETQKTLGSKKIFLEKEKNNIEDIFESFNPKSTRNIMINKSAPTSRDHIYSTKVSMRLLHNLDDQNQLLKSIPPEFSKRYDQAAKLEMLGKFAEAFDIYTQLYKDFKQDNLKELVLLGIAYNFQLQKEFDQAEKTYLKCSKYNNAQAFMKLGQLLIRRNRIDSGIQNLQKANCIKRFDKEIETKLVYGYSLKQETVQKALTLAHSILKREPMSLEILIMTAKILQKQSKIREALEICLAIDTHKESQFIKHYIGTLYLSEGNVVEAFKYFKSALQIKSNHVPSLIEIGTILSELKPKEAVSILNKALQIQPDNRLALTRLAKIYQSIESNPEKAMQIYRKTLQTKSNYEAYMKIGNCLEANGSYLQALVNYRQALNLKKTHNAYMKIAEMHEYKKQYKKSIQNYQLALDIIPKEHRFHEEKKKIMISLAKNMLILQEYDGAISTLESLLEIQESKEVYSMLGQGYFGKQEYAIALQFYEKANNLENDKDDVQILEKLALCFDKKQEFTASKKIYEKILELDPQNIKCINNYANILLILGNTNQAFYWYQVMLQSSPKNIQKRLKVADIYSAVGDWSKVEYHLLICYKQKQHDTKVLEKLINLYKQKREPKLVAKYEKKLNMLRVNNKKKEH